MHWYHTGHFRLFEIRLMFCTEPLGDCQFRTLKRISPANFQCPATLPPYCGNVCGKFQGLWDSSYMHCTATNEVVLARTCRCLTMWQILYQLSQLIIAITVSITVIIHILEIRNLRSRVKTLFKITYKWQSQNLSPNLSDSIARAF